MSLHPRLRRFLSYGLIGCGALVAISGLVNMASAWQLIDSSAEASLGITRNEFMGTYAVFLAVGAAMIYLGVRWRK